MILFERMEHLDFVSPQLFIRCFQYDRHILKPAVLHQTFKELNIHQSLTYTVMTVNTSAKGFLGVIQMYCLEIFETYDITKLIHHIVIVLYQVVTCRVSMTCVDADTHTTFIFHTVNHILELFKLETHIRAL